MSSPYGMPSSPPAKRRTPLYIALGCGCLLLALVLIALAGGGFWLLQREPDDPATDEPTTSSEPTDEPTEEPTEDPTTEPTEDPTTEPTEEPSAEPTVSLSVSGTEEAATVETADGAQEPVNGTFFGVTVEVVNEADEDLSLSPSAFTLYDDAGTPHPVAYGFTADAAETVPPGETLSVLLYADVSEGTTITSVGFSDYVATGGEEIEIDV
ncbi:DUF4352 domain-containing protein [Brachybacterium sp. GCM10030252]|uniref:DUF4352 domain-containing protein n=1 Tax=Brachybacterium sp. GCM10030252 TaxID=3273380 RepID=UPI00361D8BBA